MINRDKLKDILTEYKKDFLPRQWADEKYKWEAVQHFKEHWDINAPDFAEMFTKATAKTANLLASMNNLPRKMIQVFAKAEPETVRKMFINLYDETKELAGRVQKFSSDAGILNSNYGQKTAQNFPKGTNSGMWRNHYQGTTAISTYLWLRYPDKYYIYKYSECLATAKELESDFVPKKGLSSANLIGAYRLYDEICSQLADDAELRSLLESVIDISCYPDPELRTLTIDISYYISHLYKKEDNTWVPSDYSPDITQNKWLKLLSDSSVFTPESLQVMKRIKDYGGMATCTQLATKYGETPNFYNAVSSNLAKRVADVSGCPVLKTDTHSLKWWPILYMGKKADKDTEGSFVWKLRPELSGALDKFDLSDVSLYAEERTAEPAHNYWWLKANPKIWSFADISPGNVQSYTLYNDTGNKRRIFQNFLDAKAGDLVIGYESHPVKQIVALARVALENDGKNLYFEKTEGLSVPIDYSTLKSCRELDRMEYFLNPQGSLFKLTKGEYDFIMDIIREENPVGIKEAAEPYTKDEFLKEVFMGSEDYKTLTSLLKRRKNIILQGAPGVGKTFAAKRLAYSILGQKDESHIEFIQFHQNYSYEDFIMGYKPSGEGFELQYGIFYRFCQKAANHIDEPFFFIIDEINRGNMSKIFGELLMLIEKDYRGTKAALAYNGMPFSVPENLYLIGMMNTADRSLAMIDYALRRRFSFFKMEPGFLSEGFRSYQARLNNEVFDTLIERILDLNDEIAKDTSLGEGFCIGHSYFCGQSVCTVEWMTEVILFDILPMLGEYWFDEPDKLQRWENILRGVLNDE